MRSPNQQGGHRANAWGGRVRVLYPTAAELQQRTPQASFWVGATRDEWPLLIHARWIDEPKDSGPPASWQEKGW